MVLLSDLVGTCGFKYIFSYAISYETKLHTSMLSVIFNSEAKLSKSVEQVVLQYMLYQYETSEV